ncbi:MAG: PaaI family thioesterase [Desulfamplus sp.]|nr:PaaI family thioesterase [Desulfamplus sp.]MBF0412737.1 PaaI family thioesterase [Desulfamplus sp.]
MDSLNIVKNYFKNDRFAEHIGIEILEVTPGSAKAKMKIEDHHLNAVNLVHGGAIFGLADLVFAVASNSHGVVSLGISVSVSYIKAAQGGTLFATATEVSKNSRLGTYSIEITDEDGEIIAVFLGTVYRKKENIKDIVLP